MCNVRTWIKSAKPSLGALAHNRKTKAARLRKLHAFAEFHLREGEPFPASIIALEDEGIQCSAACGHPHVLADYLLKVGGSLGQNEWCIKSVALCEQCLVYWIAKRTKAGHFVPHVVAEIADHLLGPNWKREAGRQYRLLQVFRNGPKKKKAPKYNPSRSPAISPTASALQSFFANEKKAA